MVEVGEFARVNVEKSGYGLNVTLRKKGIHLGADINLEVMPPVTVEEIQELQAAGHIDANAPIDQFENSSSITIDKQDAISTREIDVALAVAETLASLRGLNLARVNVMGTYMFGGFEDYVKNTYLLVRQ